MWQTVGQDHLLGQISGSMRAGRIGHAYLLAGPPHAGKMTLALDIAAAVNCRAIAGQTDGPCGDCEPCSRIRRGVHADMIVLSVGGDSQTPTRISIRQVREAENFLSVTPVEGGWKTLILDGAETLSAGQSESANALLKTLEEPPEKSLLLLLTSAEDAILPTIRSRCRLLSLRPMAGDLLTDYLVSVHRAEPERARWLARLARGCPGWAITALDDPDVLESRSTKLDGIAESDGSPLDQRFTYANSLAGGFSGDREAVRQTLYLWQGWWRDLLLVKEGVAAHVQNSDRRAELESIASSTSSPAIVRFLRRLQETLTALDANANPRLALESLMLDVPAR